MNTDWNAVDHNALDRPVHLLGVLATLAICPTVQSVQTIVQLWERQEHTEREWVQVMAAATERIRELGGAT